jgi:hypothetical protein
MKTIFTFLFLIVLISGNFAQISISSHQKSGGFSSGINTEIQSFSISRIYPNPVKDFVTVELHSPETVSVQASLINILGTEVKKWDSFPLQPGDQKLKLDLSFLKTGVYFLKISNSGKVITQVIKKN